MQLLFRIKPENDSKIEFIHESAYTGQYRKNIRIDNGL